jgi:transcriptional regulator with XRE-family HTH domain
VASGLAKAVVAAYGRAMTRRRYRFDPMKIRSRPYPPLRGPYYSDWAAVVGDRIRRLREASGMVLIDLCRAVDKPDGGHYTPGFFSRLERGWASGPLATYVNVAHAFEVEPGRLLGPDDVQREISEAEMTLISVLRDLGLPPHEAIVRLTGLAG